jgi:hypothetical protein
MDLAKFGYTGHGRQYRVSSEMTHFRILRNELLVSEKVKVRLVAKV